MLKKKLSFSIVAVLTTVTLAVAALSSYSSNLELGLSTAQDKFFRGEPIPFNFTLLNRGSTPVSFRGSFGLGGDVNLLVQNPDGTESKWEGKKFYINSPTGFGTARPNEQLQQKSLLDEFKLLNQMFPRSGSYSIRVEFLYRIGFGDGNAEIMATTSNTVKIEIVDPVDRDREAYDFIIGRFVKNESKFTTEAYERDLKAFADRYSDTVYGKYLVVKLASIYHVTGRDQEAVRELCKVSNENFHFSDQVLSKLAVIDEKLHPTVIRQNLPEDAPIPTKPHPCARAN